MIILHAQDQKIFTPMLRIKLPWHDDYSSVSVYEAHSPAESLMSLMNVFAGSALADMHLHTLTAQSNMYVPVKASSSHVSAT